ncbi:glutamate receptor ionotropic, NMDA 2B-like [Centruroides vittatus]|uniref:glutamate receptor ionotropic, NMDA 2B-like n=1 Tax=Centruroides vittatus TaxID=120091 RepID=UPI00350F5CED
MDRCERIPKSIIWIAVTFSASLVLSLKPQKASFGIIVPKTSLVTQKRSYEKKVKDTVDNLLKNRYFDINFTNNYIIPHAAVDYFPSNPAPKDILNLLCDILSKDILTLLYFDNAESYGSNPAEVQYLLQLLGYLKMPVIAWNSENSGLKQRISESTLLQLAPSINHQLKAVLSILRRYSWNKFSLLTSEINGHNDFIRALRNQVQESTTTEFKFEIINIFTIKVENKPDSEVYWELEPLAKSEARIILLYSTKDEAEKIMNAANEWKITGKNYLWIATQSIIGNVGAFFKYLPPGMLGVYFNATQEILLDEIEKAIIIFAYGLNSFANDKNNARTILSSNLNCNASGESKWNKGSYFFKYLKNIDINVDIKGKPKRRITFNAEGALKYVEIAVMNLNKGRKWDRVGTWTEKGLSIKDIIWPGDSASPPRGVPEKFNLKATFMEEPPYINIVEPDNKTGNCKTHRAVPCRVVRPEMTKFNVSVATNGSDYYKCCAGFCIDLLQKFADDLSFTYDLYEVEDKKWGALNNGTWNGLIADLLSHKADIVVTSFKINSERQSAVDFTVPFLETGIAIVVAKRTGIISPKAFLEPFDTISWIMILLISIQAAAFSIFFFEWLSPAGYDKKMLPARDENDSNPDHKFSLFRTYWLVWAILFGAAVNVDCPRGYTARFMSNVWAMFAVVFLAIYTANLAAFMITREEYYDLSGIEDKRLQYPTMVDPPFRYGTIPSGNTETVLKRNKPDLYMYMKKYNQPSVQDGIKAVKMGDLDAFIYDSTVLEYLVGQDNECRLLTVGSWYAMTGYGFALPKNSNYLNMFNREMIKYRENGDLERLQRFWFQGACKPTKNKRNVSKPLDINQFMSAFLLLGCGVFLTICLLGLEHLYFRYIRKHLAKKDAGGCFTLISLSMGKSLSFRGAVFEAQDMIKHHRCKDPICDTQLWKAKHELDMANLKIRQLEAQIEGRSSSEHYFHARDITAAFASSHENYLPAHPYYHKYCRTPSTTEIAEIETVL